MRAIDQRWSIVARCWQAFARGAIRRLMKPRAGSGLINGLMKGGTGAFPKKSFFREECPTGIKTVTTFGSSGMQTAESDAHINFDLPATLCKWPSLHNGAAMACLLVHAGKFPVGDPSSSRRRNVGGPLKEFERERKGRGGQHLHR